MEFDDVTQTGELPETRGEPRRSPLPWVLLAVVAVVGVVVGGLGWTRALREAQRVNDAEESQARAEADFAAKAARVDELEKQAADRDAQVTALTAERDALAEQVKALEAKALSASTSAPAPVKKAPAKKTKKKKSTKRRTR
jgi:hypothetical protein